MLAAPNKLEVVAEAMGVVTVRTELIVVSGVGTGMGVVDVDPAGEASVDGTGPFGEGKPLYEALVFEVAGEHVALLPYAPALAQGDVIEPVLGDIIELVPVVSRMEGGVVMLS